MSIRKQAIQGVKWTTLSTIFLAVTQLLKISVLARFLDKTDFGLMAIVVFVLGFTDLFIDMGLTSAILHKQNISKNEYASLYWINFLFSFLLFAVIWFITPLVSTFYNEKELNILIPLMALTLLFSAFGRQFKTIEQKELNFKFISLVDIVGSVISLVFAVILAYYGYGIYSLVYSSILLQIISNIAFLIQGIKRIGIKLHFVFAETKPFLKIGIYQVGGQIMNYFNRDLDILLIGKFFGSEILGGYSLAKQLVFRPAQIINPILTKVGAPVLAKFQNNIEALRKNYLKLLNIISTVNFIIYLVIIVFAKYIVLILYGQGFDDIVIIVQILSVYMYFRSLGNPAGSLIIATGKTDLGFYWNSLVLLIMPIIIYTASQFSIVIVAISLSVAMVFLTIPAWYFMIRKMINVGLREYLVSFVPSVKIYKN